MSDSKQDAGSGTSFPDFVSLENQVLERWKGLDLYTRIQEKAREEGYPPFVFLEGPPTANGMPHIGHVLTRVIKDAYLRYQTMTGHYVTPRVGGWDCHGLPVELEVEKELGINSKEEIEKYGVKQFNNLCRDSVFRYVSEWIKMSERVGFLLDMNVERDPPHGAYVTMTNNYVESVWWSLAELYNKGLLFRGHKIVPYCPRCGTSLSSHELALGYKEAKDPSIFIKFNLKNSDRKLLAWTTTPWTLVSNLLLAVKEDATYAVVEVEGEELILAADLVAKVTPKAPVIEKLKGKDLVGLEYESLLPFAAKVEGKKHFVTAASFVTMEEGTGIVHCAPAFGEDDYQLCHTLGVPLYNPVDLEGKFVPEVEAYAGKFVKDADAYIIADLRAEDKLYRKTTITHTYPFCWRCDSPLLYYATESWFIGMSQLRTQLVDNNNQVRWKPDHLKHGRFGNFIDEAKDWALSRSRYWGTPLPVWVCQTCNHEFAVGSVKELRKLARLEPEVEVDLHKPFVDEIGVCCPKCSDPAVRETYVIDTWYDSGAAFFAQWHYPFDNKDLFEKHYPVEFITEAIDQTRGWFYTLLAVSTALFDKPAYLTCLTMGHILAEDGSKMSKSRGNSISPNEAFGQFGADAIRYLLCDSPTWKSTRFGENLARESVRNFQLLLWNIFSFFETYTELDGWVMEESRKIPLSDRPNLDQYAISALHSLVVRVRESFDNLEVHQVTAAIQGYLDGVVSNWWIRRSRRRFWDREHPEHESAYQTLYDIFEVLVGLMAPVVPFISDFIYHKTVLRSKPGEEQSVHLTRFPEPQAELIQPQLEENMETIRSAIAAGRVARVNANIKNRQPLMDATLVVPNPSLREDLSSYVGLLREELNVKEVKIVSSVGDLQSFQLLPNFSTIGPKFRKEAKNVIAAIQALGEEETGELVAKIHENPAHTFTLQSYELTAEDVRTKVLTKEGFEAEEFVAGLIFLNIDLSDASLVREGFVRDLIRRIQSMRRDLELEYDAKIKVTLSSSQEVVELAAEEFKDFLKTETLMEALEVVSEDERTDAFREWDITTATDQKIKLFVKISST